MKPAAFAYHAPRSLDEALALLAEHADEGRLLAGGQSLVPAMNFRLARPAVLIDINRIAALDFLGEADGWLRIGALTRHLAFERPVAAGPLATLLPQVAWHVAHLPIRVRGTFAGSLAHADPAAEWSLVAATLAAEIVALSRAGERTLPADGFFRTAFTTALRPDELIAEVRLPLLGEDWRCGFAEFSRRKGDFALAMALAAVRLEDERIAAARLGVGGVEHRPRRIEAAEALLLGESARPEVLAAAADAVAAALEPVEDIHASAEYRRDLARVMARRALEGALA
ncbi:MAG TPA: xanthine dehydrogenase family protein subunit M [Geminicoccaceae bacterium]|nr:xanthine dehydrogenase family protein subunit M [Geminicoccaceae bacterium]